MGLSLQFVEARAPDEFDRAFASMSSDDAEALLVVSDSLFGTYAAQLGQLAMKHRLPSIHGARSNVEAGGLLLYGPNIQSTVRQAAWTWTGFSGVQGRGELPVRQPTRFALVINLNTAKALGLTIPSSLLLRAEQVIE